MYYNAPICKRLYHTKKIIKKRKISKEKIYKYIKDNIKDLYTYKYILIAFVFN